MKIAKSDERSEIAVESGHAMNGGTAPVAADPFSNFDQFRLGQDFGSVLGVKKVILAIPVRKPNRQEFIQVHPSREYQFETVLLEDKLDRKHYLVAPALWSGLTGEIAPRVLFLCINRQGDPFLWPVRRPGADGRIDSWSESAITAAQLCMTQWVRVASNMTIGGYDTFTASAELAPPEWPVMTFAEILKKAFKDKIIETADHIILRRLRGEV